MPTPLFNNYFEIFSLTIVLITSSAVLPFFWKKTVSSNSLLLSLSALSSAVLGIFYSIYGLVYYFNGLFGSCTSLQVVLGTCMSASNALVFLHLFLKADIANRASKSSSTQTTIFNWKFFRSIGFLLTLFNWVTLIVVHVLLEGYLVDTVDGQRCKFKFESLSFLLKWLAQGVNHFFQTIAFVYPLYIHAYSFHKSSASSSSIQEKGISSRVKPKYQSLMSGAVLACIFALFYTLVCSALALIGFYNKTYKIPVFSLAVTNNAVNLFAAYYAMNVDGPTWSNGKKSKSYSDGNDISEVASGDSTLDESGVYRANAQTFIVHA